MRGQILLRIIPGCGPDHNPLPCELCRTCRRNSSSHGNTIRHQHFCLLQRDNAACGRLAPQGSAIAVRFAGEKTDLALRQKGKVFDLLWMNLGTVHLHNVPSVFLVASSRPLADVGGADLGLEAVRKAITAEENKGDALDIPAELIKLKQQDGLYRESTRGSP